MFSLPGPCTFLYADLFGMASGSPVPQGGLRELLFMCRDAEDLE